MQVLVTAEDFRQEPQLVLPHAAGGAGLTVWAPSYCECIQRLLSATSAQDLSGTELAASLSAAEGAPGGAAAAGTGSGTDRVGNAGAAQRLHALADLQRLAATGWLLEPGCAAAAELAGVDLAAFIFYFQNHDEVGNFRLAQRLFGLAHEPAAQRLVGAATVFLLVGCPQTPLLFMGQEFGATTPFHFFTDHNAGLGSAVERGRASEMIATWGAEAVARMVGPQDPRSFDESVLDWSELETPRGKKAFELHRECLRLRRTYLHSRSERSFRCLRLDGSAALMCEYRAKVGTGAHHGEAVAAPFAVVANFGPDPVVVASTSPGECELIEWQVVLSTWDRTAVTSDSGASLHLPAFSSVVLLGRALAVLQ